jgi:hypothetical protein
MAGQRHGLSAASFALPPEGQRLSAAIPAIFQLRKNSWHGAGFQTILYILQKVKQLSEV